MRYIYLSIAAAIIFHSLSCSKDVENYTYNQGDDSDTDISSDPVDDNDSTDYLSENDFFNRVEICWNGSSVTVSTDSIIPISIDGGNVVVGSPTETVKNLNLVLSGCSFDGSLKIYNDNKILVTLNGLSLQSSNSSAINSQDKKRLFILIADGTENLLTDASAYSDQGTEDCKAAFFSEGPLIFSGQGSLLINGNSKHGIASDDYIRFIEGDINACSNVKDAIHANEYVRMDGGTLNLTSVGDGIDSENGHINIIGGKILSVTTGTASKCLKSFSDISISGGELDLCTFGNAIFDTDDTSSSSCLKADGNIIIGNAHIICKSSGSGGKGISCNKLTVNEGTVLDVTTSGSVYYYNMSNTSSPKGIRAEDDLTINGGNVTIKVSGQSDGCEGVESKDSIIINDGSLISYAYDDAVNATKAININGGKIYAYSTNNDGIDSNGSIIVNGGLVISSGTNVPEEGVDCDQNTFTVTGGLILGLGGASSVPTSSVCTQRCVILSSLSASKSQCFDIRNVSDKSVLMFSSPRQYSQMTILMSTSDFEDGSYSVYSGGSIVGGTNFGFYYSGATYNDGSKATTFTISGIVTGGNSGGMGGGGGNPGGGNPGGWPRGMPEFPW